MKIGRLLLRLSVGGFFFGHGTQKLLGWFGGHGLKNTAEAFEGLGMRPGRVHATAAGLAEAGGGAGLALGYRTPLAASAVIATMLTAIKRVHLRNGPWITDGGYEYNVLLIVAAVTLAELGPGPVSLDALRGRERAGVLWALVALTLGAAGATGAHLLAESQKGAAAPAAAATAASAPEPPAPAPAPAPAPQAAPAEPVEAGSEEEPAPTE